MKANKAPLLIALILLVISGQLYGLKCFICSNLKSRQNNTCTIEPHLTKSVEDAPNFKYNCRLLRFGDTIVGQDIVPETLCTDDALGRAVSNMKLIYNFNGNGDDPKAKCCPDNLCNDIQSAQLKNTASIDTTITTTITETSQIQKSSTSNTPNTTKLEAVTIGVGGLKIENLSLNDELSIDPIKTTTEFHKVEIKPKNAGSLNYEASPSTYENGSLKKDCAFITKLIIICIIMMIIN